MKGAPDKSTAIMRKIVLPKNLGPSKILWHNKHPLYTLTYTKDPHRYQLMKRYKGKIDFIYKKFDAKELCDVDEFFQNTYEDLIFFHGLLSKKGILLIDTSIIFRGCIGFIVSEVFGEGRPKEVGVYFVAQ